MTYATTDFDLVNALLSHGYQSYKIDSTNPKRVIFYFNSDTELKDLVNKFHLRELAVEPVSFCQNRRQLKARMMDEINNSLNL
jgi:hypothetical protein